MLLEEVAADAGAAVGGAAGGCLSAFWHFWGVYWVVL